MNTPPSTPDRWIAALTRSLVEEGFDAGLPPPAATLEEAARAVFTLAARVGASFFTLWADTLDDGTASAGTTFLFLPPPEPGRSGLLGQEPRRVRQHIDPALHAPLGQALAHVARRGQDGQRPTRGRVTVQPSELEPELLFLVDFQDGDQGSEVSALARDREAQALFPSFSALPVSPEEAALLEETFSAPHVLFQGRMVLFIGEAAAERAAAWRAALAIPPRHMVTLVALERPLPLDPRLGALLLGDDLPLTKALAAFSRQDPDLIYVELVRAREELRLLGHISTTGHGVVAQLDARTPEAAVQRLNEAVGMPCQPLIVQCAQPPEGGPARLSVHTVSYAPDSEEPQVARWSR